MENVLAVGLSWHGWCIFAWAYMVSMWGWKGFACLSLIGLVCLSLFYFYFIWLPNPSTFLLVWILMLLLWLIFMPLFSFMSSSCQCLCCGINIYINYYLLTHFLYWINRNSKKGKFYQSDLSSLYVFWYEWNNSRFEYVCFEIGIVAWLEIIILRSPEKGAPWKFWLDSQFLRNFKLK